jgi:hypothetical protein
VTLAGPSPCLRARSRHSGRTAATRGASALSLVFAFVFLFGACGTSQPTCVPGQSIACSRGTCEGYQVCNAEGSAYDECRCGGPDAGEFPAGGPNSGLIGAACTSSADCREGFDCLSSESRLINGQGPSGGICLAKCIPEHDFCKGLDARSKCIVLYDGGTPSDKLDDVTYCLPGCETGTQPNELDKCRRRADLVCAEAPAGAGVGFCRPACRSDVDCGSRFCDLGTGLCGDQPQPGGEIGSVCNQGSDSTVCAGGCIDLGSSHAECSGVCSYGTAGCGQETEDGPLDYFCFHGPAAGSGEGDLGYCARLCDCDDDCERDDSVCEPRDALPESTRRAGVCSPTTYPNGDPRPNTPC